ncbi:hypothetical protein Gobs_0723 [Geodermatophilus obscurus DSM 43160]|uniref:Uncharacterized protein n=1 Tax=Geodermatophilus obscurus (strain ATCC 25078 / DSM 43160 / JCM 3152 / CCUG 61914 / KCC A-0152 / KCTC 9177 / NBRC 13315 / NRRL B-3577 / G-20) TaxID=526225 RepID=D2S871_GEOOG|nr:hypothetical protein Gobs_0723 [Geodermatophilus obscurus DSM 43160]
MKLRKAKHIQCYESYHKLGSRTGGQMLGVSPPADPPSA